MSWNRQLRDVVFRAHVGNLRIAGVMARNSVKEAARRWELPLASKASRTWGEYMVGTAMLSSFYKGEERVKVSLRSQSIQDLYVEAMAVGEVCNAATTLLQICVCVFSILTRWGVMVDELSGT